MAHESLLPAFGFGAFQLLTDDPTNRDASPARLLFQPSDEFLGKTYC
jgi:hypothetical protein